MKSILLTLIAIITLSFGNSATEICFNYKNIVIVADTVKNKANFLIFDLSGKTVAGGTFAKKTEFSMTLLPKGIYYVYVWVDDKFYYKKFMIV